MELRDTFLVRNSETIIDYLKGDANGMRSAFSLDVEDLFYSIPHDHLFSGARKCIERNGEVSFANSSGISAESFLELEWFYLSHTYVSFQGDMYVQKKGICIWSCVAPVPPDIFFKFYVTTPLPRNWGTTTA